MWVGLWSHNLMSGVVRDKSHDATRESVVGRRTKLLNGLHQHHWQAGLQLPFRVGLIQSPAMWHGKQVSPAKRFNQGGLWAPKKIDATW